MLSNDERAILRLLGEQYAQAATTPQQAESRRLWAALNDGRPERPLVVIDEEPWHELERYDSFLTCQIADPLWRGVEASLRRRLYRYRHHRVDMALDPFFSLPKAIVNTEFGMSVHEDTAAVDAKNNIVGHRYHNQFVTDEDLQKLQTPVVTHDAAETARRKAEAEDVFTGLLPVRMAGLTPMFAPWDRLSTWLSPEACFTYLYERPDYVHRLMERITAGYMAMLDQIEAQGLLSGCLTTLHCCPVYGSFPAVPYESDCGPRLAQTWTRGMAQIFASVSPAAHDEFEFAYMNRVYERFGAVYYGCCEQLHDRMAGVLRIPHLRMVSCSPWCRMDAAADFLAGTGVVASNKPAPAFLASDSMNWAAVERDLRATKEVCRRKGVALEFVLKDISTVRYEPDRLSKWADLAMKVAME